MSIDLNKSDSAQPGSRSGSKIIKIAAVAVVVVAAALALAWHLANKRAADEAAEAFALAMDWVAGPGRWTVGSTGYAAGSKTLTAKDVTVDLSHLDKTITEPLTIGTVTVVGGLRRDDLKALRDLADWRDQADRHLADSVTLSGIGLDTTDGRDRMIFGTDAAHLGGIDLVAAGPDNPAGPLGFLKSLRIQSLAVDRGALSVELKDSMEVAVKMELGRLEAADLHAGQGLGGVASLAAILPTLSAANLAVAGVGLQSGTPGGQNNVALSVREASATDADRLAFGSISVKGLAASVASQSGGGGADEKPLDLAIAVEDLQLKDLDLAPLYRRVLDLQARLGPGSPGSSAAGNFYTLADLFTQPFSIGSATGRGYSMDIDGQIKLGLAEASYTGPSRAGRIPPSHGCRIEGLRLELPGSPPDRPDYAKAYEFGLKFGQNVFTARYLSATTYDPATGAYNQSTAPLLDVDGLATVNGEFNLSGLTPALLDAMAKVPVAEAENIFYVPEFLDLGLVRIHLEILNSGLMDRILGYHAAKNSISLEESRRQAAASVKSVIALSAVENRTEIAEAASAFVLAPRTLVLDVSPSQPLTISSAALFALGDAVSVINSLNITAAFNGAAPLSVKLVDARRAPDSGGGEGFDFGDPAPGPSD
jgi:hypothetical protein